MLLAEASFDGASPEMLEVNRKPNNGPVSRSAANTNRPYSEIRGATPVLVHSTRAAREGQSRVPVITGEVQCKGYIAVDGSVSGQLGSNLSMNVRQKPRAAASSEPELAGEITFRDMIRVNGHIAGTVYSQSGTMIVDATARVDANVEVAVAIISGTVNGDIVAYERVEVGPNARVHGNIWTRSIEIKNGAVFEGACRMLNDERAAAV